MNKYLLGFFIVLLVQCVGISADDSGQAPKHFHYTSFGYNLYDGPGYESKSSDIAYVYYYSDILELQASYDQSDTTFQEMSNLSFSTDFYYDSEWSPFLFYRDQDRLIDITEYEIKKVAAGLSWMPKALNDSEQFPFKHKLSLAVINDIDSDTYMSFRYKFKATVSPVNLSVVYFKLSKGETVSVDLDYDLNEWLYLNYSYNYENAPYRIKGLDTFDILEYDETSLSLNVTFKFKN